MEPEAVMQVTEVVSAEPQPVPVINRKMVLVPERDAQGKPTGEMVEQEHISGNWQTDMKLIPEGGEVTLDYKVNGIVISTLGPVISKPLSGRNFGVQARLVIGDNCGISDFERPEPEVPE